jgi:hypothetical protein
MCYGGDTPGFRPHAGRISPWAFPGAEEFQTELATSSGSEGHFESPDEWLTMLKTDIIIAFFGYNESFQGPKGLENYKAELEAFIHHTQSTAYNGNNPPQLALVSPIAFEDLTSKYDLPDGKKENENLELYTQAMKEVAERNEVLFVDAFTPSKKWYASGEGDHTVDGFQLNETGYKKLSTLLVNQIFGKTSPKVEEYRDRIHEAVMEKNWMWHNDYKIPNGVHVFGRRYKPFGPDNYPYELEKIREMTANRDEAIWQASIGEGYDLVAAEGKELLGEPGAGFGELVRTVDDVVFAVVAEVRAESVGLNTVDADVEEAQLLVGRDRSADLRGDPPVARVLVDVPARFRRCARDRGGPRRGDQG